MIFASPSARMYTVFFAASLPLGNWYPRIADIQERLALDSISLGQSLAGLPMGIMLGFSLLARVVHQSSFRQVFGVGTPVLALSLMAAALAPSGPVLFLALMAAGAAQGALGIAGNVEADRMETALGRPVLVRGHGFWSLATLIGGAMAAGFKGWSVEPVIHFAIVIPLSLLLLWLGLRGFSASPRRGDEASAPAPALVLPTRAVVVLFAAGGLVLYLDSAASDWSVILMRDALGVGAFLSGLAFTAWALGQTAGRLLHPTLASRLVPTAMALGFLTLAAMGVAIIAVSGNAALTIVGFVLLGLGTSSMLPMALSAAARLQERPPAANVASLSQLAFLVSVLSPPVVGRIVEAADIRLAFLLGLAVLAVSAATVLVGRPFLNSQAPSATGAGT